MRIVSIILSSIISMFFLTGCNSWEERKAEKVIDIYYNALINQDYEKAFTQLNLYEGQVFDGTELSIEESEKVFLEKMDYLENRNYKLTHFRILEIEYEDGHSFWHHLEIKGETDGQEFIFKEIAFLKNSKLYFSSEDPFIDYRNGKMDVKLLN